jgi:hypothetical protein
MEIAAVPNSKLCFVGSILAKLHLMEFETDGTLQAYRGSLGLRERLDMLSSSLAPDFRQKGIY